MHTTPPNSKAILERQSHAFAYGMAASALLGAASWPRLVANPRVGAVPWTLGSSAAVALAYFTYLHLYKGPGALSAKLA
jgi:hypothetical protein